MFLKLISGAVYSEKLKGWGKIAITFLTGQGVLQSIQLVSGILIVRWMPVEQYAQYTLAFALQATALNLVDAGFAGSIIDLVGRDINDRKKIGGYIKAANYFRNRLLLVVGLVFTFVYFLITQKYNWTLTEKFGLFFSILLTLFFTGLISFYKPILQINKQFKEIYVTEIYQALVRLFFILALYLLVGLIAWQLALISALVLLFRGLSLRKKAREFVDEPEGASQDVRKEMVRYISPIFPGIIFAAFQGQISALLISFFGSVQAIAEVGALGRLAQLFMIFNTSFSMLLVPYFARQTASGLLKKYILIVVGIALCLAGIVAAAFLFPDLFLMVLGKNYQGLSTELYIVISTASLNVLNSALWGMNKSRKWVFPWMPVISIPGIILIQILSIIFLDLSITFNVVLMGLFTSIYSLLTRVNVAFWGFKKLTRENN